MRIEKVWTRAQLLANTYKAGSCRVWKGPYTDAGDPLVRHKNKRTPARRLLVELSGKEVPDGHVVGRVESCENRGCICEEHAVIRARSDHMRSATARKTETASSLANRRIAARKRGKLTTEQARSIRSDLSPLADLAKQYGVSSQTIWRIKKGRIWKESASPFAGLGA